MILIIEFIGNWVQNLGNFNLLSDIYSEIPFKMKISHIFQEILNEDFKSQSAKFIKQGIDPEVVKNYVDKFKHIRDKKFKEMFDTDLDISVAPDKRNNIDSYTDFHDLEQLVDYVGGRRQGVSTFGSGNEQIEIDAKPVYKDENFEVYYADTPRACIKYKGKFPYSWCVARSDSSNMFYTYRFKPYEPAFYFVKNLKLAEKEFGVWNMTKNVFKGQFKYPYHFFVIQVPKNAKMDDLETQQYFVTSANNDGDKQLSWNEILGINPKLKVIRDVLVPKPFTPEEREKNERFKNGISDQEFAKLSYEDKRSYLDIYPTIARPITFRQLTNLPDDLLNLYVSFGIGLDDKQFEFIKPKKDILKRYTQISKKKLEEYLKRDGRERRQLKMNFTELIILSDEDIRSYLESLDQKEINAFVHTFGEDKLEFLQKHLPNKFTEEHKSIGNLLKLANNGNEEAYEKIKSMIPEDVDVTFYNGYITFDTSSYGSYLKKHMDSSVYELLEKLDYDTWNSNGYNYSYYDGDSDRLDEDYEYYLETFITNHNEFADQFKAYGLGWDKESLKDLLESYKKVDEIKGEIDSKYSEAKDEGEEKAWDKIRNSIKAIMYLDNDDTDLNLRIGPFIMALTKENIFSTDKQLFIDNLISLADEILEGYDVPTNYESVWEEISETGNNNMEIDNDSIYNSIEKEVDNALEELSSDDDSSDETNDGDSEEETKLVKLKSQIILLLNDTLKRLGQDPTSSRIENEIAIIEIDRKKFQLDGKVFIKFTDKQHGESREGYIPIKDIPSYFTNHKLFEQVNRIKKLIRY